MSVCTLPADLKRHRVLVTKNFRTPSGPKGSKREKILKKGNHAQTSLDAIQEDQTSLQM